MTVKLLQFGDNMNSAAMNGLLGSWVCLLVSAEWQHFCLFGGFLGGPGGGR